jgi:hypothetical protein
MATRCCHRQDAEGRGPRRPVARSADRRRRASLRLGSGATGRTHQRARLSRGGPLPATISRADLIPLKRIALALPSSAESITLLHGDERAKCGAAAKEGVQVGPRLGLVGSMEATAILPKGQKYIKPLRCSECGGNAVLIRRSPHPLDGLEIRTFECQKCGNQTRRIVNA